VQDLPSDVIERCQRGDVAALGEIYAAHGARVWRVARNLLGREADADDLTQDVFLRLFERIHQFEGRSSLATWIHRTTVNLCLNRIAERNRKTARSLDDVASSAAEPADLGLAPSARAESADELEAWLGPLDPDARAILVLREVEGLEYSEIAAALDVPIGTVMSRLSRAREKLAELARRRARSRAGARTTQP
jgi:RNA polymerase sigma-70 factor (ECF subfamily)